MYFFSVWNRFCPNSQIWKPKVSTPTSLSQNTRPRWPLLQVVSPCDLIGLCLARPHGLRSGHHALSFQSFLQPPSRRWSATLQVGTEVLPKTEDFKYLGIWFTSERRRKQGVDSCSRVNPVPVCCGEESRAKRQRVPFPSQSAPTFTLHLRLSTVVNDWKDYQKYKWLELGDSGGMLRWWFRCLLGSSLRKCFRHVQPGEDQEIDPGYAGGWPGKILLSSQRSWRRWMRGMGQGRDVWMDPIVFLIS